MSKRLKVGDTVNYHSIIGGEITSKDHKINHIGYLGSNQKVAWITNKVGAVHIKALSKDNLVK